MNTFSFLTPFKLGIFLWVLLVLPAQAHWADMATMDMQMKATEAESILKLPAPFVSQFDTNQDTILSADEITRHSKAILALFAPKVQVYGDYLPGKLKVSAFTGVVQKLNGNPTSALRLNWHWEKPVTHIQLNYQLFPKDAPNAHCLASITQNNKTYSLVLKPSQPRITLSQPTVLEQLGYFFYLGLEHILTGYDHLLFLFALLIVGGQLKYLLKIVTAFTLAHSVTLSLAVFNLVSAPSRWIESLIAASIIFVALESLLKKEETKWYIVFAFGLIHGLGFANILREMNLPVASLIYPLISFNVGIEIGQLFAVTLFWLALRWFTEKEWYVYIQWVATFGIVSIAGYWFIERAFLGG